MLASPSLFSLENLLLIAGFAFIGGSLRFIDLAFDNNRFDKRLAIALAIPAGLITGYFISSDVSAATILLAIVVASLFAGKVDNIAFQLGALALLASVAAFFPGIPALATAIISPAFVALVVTGIIDEWGNDLADEGRLKGLAKEFFVNRMAMKIAAVALFVAGVFQPIYLIAFLAFDIAYPLVGKASRWK